jgi:sulfate adenylyltransferase
MMIKPHGSDVLHPLYVSDDVAREHLLKEAETLPSLLLNSAAAANAVMLGAGYFNPLQGYMNLADALSVAENMHTTDGLFWPVPVVNLTQDTGITAGARLALRDPNVEGHPILAVMDVTNIEAVTDSQIATMANQIFGTDDARPPRRQHVYSTWKSTFVRAHSGSKLQLFQRRVCWHLSNGR